MLTTRGIQAGVGQAEPFHRSAANNVRLNNLLDIRLGHSAIPYRIWINNDVGAVLALIETSSLIGANLALQPALSQFLLEQLLQFGLRKWIAASPRMPRWTLVSADKDVFLKFRHQATVRTGTVSSASRPASQMPSKSTK